MTKFAVWFLVAVAFQAAFAGVPRYMNSGGEMMPMNDFKDMFMFFENFCHSLEYKDVDKNMMICCIREFIMFMNMLCEEFECSTCTDQIFVDCVMVCKKIKMECEKMLKYVDVREMKMDFVKCVRMFCMDLKKWCMHEEFFVKFMREDILMHLNMMVNKCMGTEFSKVISGDMMNMHSMNRHMMNEDMMNEPIMRKHMMGENMMGGHMMGDQMMGEHMMDDHMMDGHMMNEHMMGEHMMDGHMMNKHMMVEHMMGGQMMGKHMMNKHMMGEHMIDDQMMGENMMDDHMMDGHMMSKHMMDKHFMSGLVMTNKDYFMHFKLLCRKFITFCKTTDMSHDMIMNCMRKLMMVIDYTMEKLCTNGKCDDMMMSEICTELKNIKMVLERCLSYGMLTDMHKMKMKCCECVKMFFRCMEKWMMCDNCCVNFDMICKDICMRFMGFYKAVCGSTMYRGSYSLTFNKDFRMLVKKLVDVCESGKMTKEMMMMCMRKLMMIVDFAIKKLCFGDKCNDSMMSEVCVELKKCKMMLERCLSYGMFTNMYRMKMECSECFKMFLNCMEKWMMCDNCCVGFEMMSSDVFMRFQSLFDAVFEKMNMYGMDYWLMPGDYSIMYDRMKTMNMMPYFMYRNM